MSQQPTKTTKTTKTRERRMDGLWLIGLLAIWFVLQLWVLPKLGVPT